MGKVCYIGGFSKGQFKAVVLNIDPSHRVKKKVKFLGTTFEGPAPVAVARQTFSNYQDAIKWCMEQGATPVSPQKASKKVVGHVEMKRVTGILLPRDAHVGPAKDVFRKIPAKTARKFV